MPILTVEIVHDPGTVLAPDLAQKLADAAGRVLEAAPGTTWVTVSAVPWERYAESGGASSRYRPIFVRVLKRVLPDDSARRAEASSLTRTIADVCGWDPNQVHVIYEPPALGRVSFGGRMVE